MMGYGRVIAVWLLVMGVVGNSYGQRTVKITSILDEPYLTRKADFDTLSGNDKYEGFCKDLADLLAEQLKVNYTLVEVGDNKFGSYHNKTGTVGGSTWNGMIGELVEGNINKRADIAIGAITITKERAQAVDFSSPFLEFQLGILMRKPTEEEKDDDDELGSYIFLRPLTGPLWAVFIVSLVLLVLLLFLVERFVGNKVEEARVRRANQPGAGIPPPPALPVGLCSHGICGSPKSTAGRFLQVIFWIFVVIFVGAYIATFAADRIVDRLSEGDEDSLDIKSIEDLGSQKDIQYGILRAGSTYDYFRFSKVPIYRKMFREMLRDDQNKKTDHTLMRTMHDGLDRVRRENDSFAFILESPYAVYENGRQPCNTVLAPQFFGPKKGYGVATRPNFDLRSSINLAILELKENGQMESLEAKWFKDHSNCPAAEEDDDLEAGHGPLCLETMAGVFYILIVAIIIGLIIAGVEIVMSQKRNAKKGSRNDRSAEVPLRETA